MTPLNWLSDSTESGKYDFALFQVLFLNKIPLDCSSLQRFLPPFQGACCMKTQFFFFSFSDFHLLTVDFSHVTPIKMVATFSAVPFATRTRDTSILANCHQPANSLLGTDPSLLGRTCNISSK